MQKTMFGLGLLNVWLAVSVVSGADNTGAGNTGAGNTGAGNTGAGNTGAVLPVLPPQPVSVLPVLPPQPVSGADLLPEPVIQKMHADQGAAESSVRIALNIEEHEIRQLSQQKVEDIPYKVVYVDEEQLPCFVNHCFLRWTYSDLADPWFPISRIRYCRCLARKDMKEEVAGHSCCCCCGRCDCRGDGHDKPCIKYCTLKTKDKVCTGGKIWTACGTTCTPTCYDPKPTCTATCTPRCQCPPEKPIWSERRKECVDTRYGCEGKCHSTQEWKDCGSACTKTCQNYSTPCVESCVYRCQCPANLPIWHGGTCVATSSCN